MKEYRKLTEEEIRILEERSCWAEEWANIHVAAGFKPNYMHRVMLYGEVYIGAFDDTIEVSRDFFKHSGINNATLRNVTIGDNSLVENIGNYINNYTRVAPVHDTGPRSDGACGRAVEAQEESGCGDYRQFSVCRLDV